MKHSPSHSHSHTHKEKPVAEKHEAKAVEPAAAPVAVPPEPRAGAMTGKVLSVLDGTVTIVHSDGTTHAHTVSPKCDVTLRSYHTSAIKLADLVAGDAVEFSGNPVDNLKATR